VGAAAVVQRSHKKQKLAEGYAFEEQLARATAKARVIAPDAELVSAWMGYVDPSGRVEALEIPRDWMHQNKRARGYDDTMRFTFRSPSRAALATHTMLGAPAAVPDPHTQCQLRVRALRRDRHLPGRQPARESSLAQVWSAAIKRHAPTPALAEVRLKIAKSGAGEWAFVIRDHNASPADPPVFEAKIPDDCR
jgi:hypothetical protein